MTREDELDLEPIKTRRAAATAGTWFIEGCAVMDETRSLTMVLLPELDEPEDVANAEFIVHAPDMVDALVAEVERLRGAIARYVAAEMTKALADARVSGSPTNKEQ